ncbi:DUF6783 domain-containing protein, partial [Anaerobutyricum hallii]
MHAQSPANCDTHLAESIFQTRSRACLKNKSYTKHKSYYCLLILKISKINIIYII